MRKVIGTAMAVTMVSSFVPTVVGAAEMAIDDLNDLLDLDDEQEQISPEELPDEVAKIVKAPEFLNEPANGLSIASISSPSS